MLSVLLLLFYLKKNNFIINKISKNLIHHNVFDFIKDFSIIFFSIILNSLIKLLNYFALIGLKNSNPLKVTIF